MRRTLAALVLIAPACALVPVLATTAAAGGETCLGQTATIVGTDDDDVIHGTLLPDVVVLGAGDDKFYGKEGDDVICGGAGNDRIFAGPGNDRVDGGKGNDKLYGYTGDDELRGGGGNDILRGEADNDTLRGGGGRDVALESAGDDLVTGGGGKDAVSYAESETAVTVNWATGVVDGAGHDVIGNTERFVGSPFADVVNGSDKTDDLDGGGGDDRS